MWKIRWFQIFSSAPQWAASHSSAFRLWTSFWGCQWTACLYYWQEWLILLTRLSVASECLPFILGDSPGIGSDLTDFCPLFATSTYLLVTLIAACYYSSINKMFARDAHWWPLFLLTFHDHSFPWWISRFENKLMEDFHLAQKYCYMFKFLFLFLVVLPICCKGIK